jgi:hypothetical protein
MEGSAVSFFKSLWGIRRTWTRHDLIQAIGGVMYIMLGLAYIMEPSNRGRQIALYALLRIAPIEFWGGVFVSAGLLALISSKWPPLVEAWGYVVLTGLSLAWGTAYLTGILFTDSPRANISGFLIFSTLGVLWWAISGLRNPEPVGALNVARPG